MYDKLQNDCSRIKLLESGTFLELLNIISNTINISNLLVMFSELTMLLNKFETLAIIMDLLEMLLSG